MAKQSELFERPKRKAPRIIAHFTDVGDHGCIYRNGNDTVADFSCKKCGWESGWIETRRGLVAKGVPCAACNPLQTTGDPS